MNNPNRLPMPTPSPRTRPNPLQMFFHIGKTARLAGALLGDPRITIFRKIVFLGSILLLLLALVGGDTVSSAISEFIFPLIGPFVDLPAEIGFDWIAVAVAAYNLLGIFPAELVAEHYDRLFRPIKMA